jgi:ferredoxin-NADP reductase
MNLIIQLLAIGLLAGLTGYIAALVAGQLRGAALASRGADLERAYLEARIRQVMDRRRFETERHELSWNGYRKFQVVRKVPESKDICSFYLAPHDRKPLPPYQPGQYLTFQLTLDGKGGPSGKPVIRCYSLSDSPFHKDYYRVSIKRVPPPPNKPEIPPGLISGHFHDAVKEGDILDVKAPSGQFVLDLAKPTPVVLIGGGVGLTPVLSMLNAIVESGSTRETWFFYGARDGGERIMKEHLARVAREHPTVHVQVCFSNPTEKDVAGQDYHHGERVSVDLFKRVLPSSNFEFYICGPPPMMNTITQDLDAWGVPSTRVFFEAFGPATVKKLAPAAAPAGAEAPAVEVTFAKSGKTCPWMPNGHSLLEFAEAQGVSIDSGCRAGNCGTCLTAIKSGEVRYTVEHGAKPETGSCLVCIAVPKGPLVLDA